MLRIAIFILSCAVLAIGGGWVRSGMALLLLCFASLCLAALCGILAMAWGRR